MFKSLPSCQLLSCDGLVLFPAEACALRRQPPSDHDPVQMRVLSPMLCVRLAFFIIVFFCHVLQIHVGNGKDELPLVSGGRDPGEGVKTPSQHEVDDSNTTSSSKNSSSGSINGAEAATAF